MPIAVRNLATTIGTTVTEIYRVPVPRLRSVLIRNQEAAGGNNLFIGTRGLSTANGLRLEPGETFGMTHDDFLRSDVGDLVLYGVGSAADTDYAILEVVTE